MSLASSPTSYVIDNHTLLFDASLVQGHSADALQSLIWQLAEHAHQSNQFIDIVPAMHSLTLYAHPGVDIVHWQGILRARWDTLAPQNAPGKLVEIPTFYGSEWGPDLRELAQQKGLSEGELIERHCKTEYKVMFLGFQPGFAYLSGLDPFLFSPRRSEPREKIPKGSVAIGGELTGIYPADSPGGWHIIGRTFAPLFDVTRVQASLLQPGDRVRFVPVTGRPS